MDPEDVTKFEEAFHRAPIDAVELDTYIELRVCYDEITEKFLHDTAAGKREEMGLPPISTGGKSTSSAPPPSSAAKGGLVTSTPEEIERFHSSFNRAPVDDVEVTVYLELSVCLSEFDEAYLATAVTNHRANLADPEFLASCPTSSGSSSSSHDTPSKPKASTKPKEKAPPASKPPPAKAAPKECWQCKGSGYQTCGSCSAHLKGKCPHCKGAGKQKCKPCGGKGVKS